MVKYRYKTYMEFQRGKYMMCRKNFFIYAILISISVFLLSGCDDGKTPKDELKDKDTIAEKSNSPLSSDELNYLKTLEKSLEVFTDKTTDISRMMEQADKNPSIIHDEEWMQSLKDDFLSITISSSLMVTMSDENNVPSRFLNLHNNAQQTFELMSYAGEKLIQSFQNNLDMTLFNQSMELMSKSSKKMDEVTKETHEINSEVNTN
jgi:hypothetical protein